LKNVNLNDSKGDKLQKNQRHGSLSRDSIFNLSEIHHNNDECTINTTLLLTHTPLFLNIYCVTLRAGGKRKSEREWKKLLDK
jgi:hypothetical protein